MTLRHFQIFVSVCDHMNMTAAANELFMSQSAVSQAIAELERFYDVRLFERLSKKLYLTKAGEKLLSYARHMVAMNTEISKDMKTMHESGYIRIGASVTVCSCVLPKLVSSYQAAYPNTDIEVVEDNTQQIEKLILADKIDLGLVEGEITFPDIRIYPFMKDELVLICGIHHRFAKLSSVEPHELEKEKFIVRENGSGTRRTFENVMAANGLIWKAAWTCNNAETIKIAVAEGLGISVISRRTVEREISSGLLCTSPIEGLGFQRTFKIVYHKNKYLSQMIRKFIDFSYEYK